MTSTIEYKGLRIEKTLFEYANHLKLLPGSEYEIYFSKWESGGISTYFHIVHGNKIAYVQKTDYSGFSISSVHKPCREAGTGYGLFDNIMPPLLGPINEALNTVCPYWGTIEQSKAVKKYANWDEYTNKSGCPKYIELTV